MSARWLLVTALLPGLAWADGSVNLGEVVVTDTAAPVARLHTPDNTVRLDTGTLSLLGETHPAQIFNRVPGAMLSDNGGQESLMALRSPLLTGVGACGAFLLLEDGIPIQPAGFCDDNAVFWLNTEQAAAMEVIRGPGSVLYGGNALHGIVNVFTPGPDLLPADSLGAEFGSNDYLRVKASWSGWDGSGGWRASANAAHDGGFRADSGYDQQKLMLRLDSTGDAVSRETLLAATNLNQDTAGYIYGQNAYQDESLRDSNPTPGAFRDTQSWLLAQKWRISLADERELDVDPYLRRNTMRFTEHYIPAEPIQDDAQNSAGALLKLRTRLGSDTAMIYGLDVEYAHGGLTEFQPAPLTTSSPQQDAIRPQGLHYDYQADSRALAGYLDLTRQWSPAWLFSGGLRLERVQYSYVNFLPVGDTRADGTACGFGGCLFNRPADRSDEFVNLLPKFGLSWLATADEAVYANLGRGARAPQTQELYELQSHQQLADLHSETLNNFEVGWRGRTAGLSWDVDGYYMLKDHFIFRDANGFNVSDGRTRHRGLEFSADYAFSPQWTLLLEGTYAVHSYAFSAQVSQGGAIAYGNDVKYAPRTLGTAALRWQPDGATRVELQYLHLGGYWLDESNQHRYGGHDLVNLYARREFGDGYSLSLRLLNLADVAYAEHADFNLGKYRYFPGDGREIFVGLEKSW
ncbi:MAG TPA: TonB-dependent receptor [Gammaproteobacteria bacterium]|nr:TonB-dependent receptor [Gammaproteobacteria bacterium]